MESAEFLSGDGTFEVTKSTKFAQMWIIMTKLDKSAIPVAFYLLPSKEQIAYKLMFQSLLKVSSNILPNYWLLDYEKGTINALKEVFGNQAVVQGCLVHWKRCVFRKIQDLGLVEVINHDSSVAKWVRSFHVLQLVPIEDLDMVMSVLEEGIPYEDEDSTDDDSDLDDEDMEAKARTKGYNAALDEFYHYFETTWVGPKTSTRGGQRRKPRYSPKIWSVRDSIIQGEEWTTNISESFNSVNKLSTVSRPSLWGLLSMFRDEEASARAKMANIRCGKHVDQNHGRTRKREETAERLRDLVKSYSTMNIRDFIDASLGFYNEFNCY